MNEKYCKSVDRKVLSNWNEYNEKQILHVTFTDIKSEIP